MSINAISAAISASVYLRSSGISKELYNKLLDLDVDLDTVSSVDDATQAVDKAAEETNETEETDEQNQSEEDSDLRDRAENLADKLGIKVDDDDTIDDIIDEIQEEIDAQMKVAARNNDEAYYNTLKGYQLQLDGIIAENNGGGIMPSVVFDFMDMVAEQNKFALGITQK